MSIYEIRLFRSEYSSFTKWQISSVNELDCTDIIKNNIKVLTLYPLSIVKNIDGYYTYEVRMHRSQPYNQVNKIFSNCIIEGVTQVPANRVYVKYDLKNNVYIPL